MFPPTSRFHVDRKTGCSVFSLLYCQVYTRFHFLSSDPGAEAGVVRRLRICVCPQCLVALSHVSHMCRDPAQAHLGAPALHYCVCRYEVGVAEHRKQNMQNTVPCDNQFITKTRVAVELTSGI